MWHPVVMADDAAPPMLTAVLEVARRQLGEVGPTALSLRSIAREIGVVPSALYRYLPGREAILTQLIQTGYERLAAAVREAEEAVPRQDHLGRWLTIWRATRDWALDHPHEYALLYGTPVVGYAAPSSTIEPATAVVLMLARVAIEAHAAGARPAAETQPELAQELRDDARTIEDALPRLGVEAAMPSDPQLVLLVVDAWTTLFGAISFELFGHYERSITARGAHLEALAQRRAAELGIVAAEPSTG